MSVGHHTFNNLEREQTYAMRAAQGRLTALENTLYQKLDPETFYGQLDLSGNYWGPSFAAITDFTLGDSDAIGKITIPDVQQSMPGNFMQPHVIHPTTLDALIHSSLVLFSQSSDLGVMLLLV